MRRLSLATAILVLAAGSLALTEDGAELPAACTDGAPALADDEVLVERTLYFHGDAPSGTPGQVSAFPLGYDDAKTMDEEEPTGGEPKVDVLFGVGLNNAFVGGPTLPYWRTFFEDDLRIVCASVEFYAGIPGNAEVRLFADPTYATGETTALAAASPTGDGDSFTRWVADFDALDVEAYEFLVQISHVSATSPRDAGLVAYDATATPSAVHLVTVGQAPAA